MNETIETLSAQIMRDANTEYDIIIDKTDTDNYYVGYGLAGALITDAKWKIKKMPKIGAIEGARWADGSTKMNKVWTQRASYAYAAVTE